MRFYFKPKVTIICVVLIVCMLKLALWQWHRHLEKITLVQEMDARLAKPPEPLESLFPQSRQNDLQYADSIVHRRVTVSGRYDFAHEMLLRNRRLGDAAGAHVLTPMLVTAGNYYVLVDRGFVPLSKSEPKDRAAYQKPAEASFTGLVKDYTAPYFIAPQDPPVGPGLPWLDAWLRVNPVAMSKQLPYQLIPIYLEIMDTNDPTKASSEILKSNSEREELLIPGLKDSAAGARSDFDPALNYPVPIFDTVIPPARHLGYVYEWSTMALMTFLIGIVLQLKPERRQAN